MTTHQHNQNMSSRSLLAFDIGGTRIKSGIIQNAHVVNFDIIEIKSLDAHITLIDALVRQADIFRTKYTVDAVGLSIRGIVDPISGILLDVNGPMSEWIGQPLISIITERLALPAVIENDARMYALGEQMYGAGRGYQNLICLTLGTGIGCGVILDGQLLRGARGSAGILGGHITIQVDGDLCSCGNRGCLETLASSEALKAQIRQALLNDHSSLLHAHPDNLEQLFMLARQKDQLAQEIVQRFTRYLGAGIVSLIHTFDPDIVIIGGGIAHAADTFLDQVQEYVDTHAWTLPRRRVRLIPAQLGDQAAIVGSAAFAEHMLRSSY